MHPGVAPTTIDVIAGPPATAGTNTAVTDLLRSIVIVVGFADPVASPPQAENKYPGLGVPVSVTWLLAE